MSRRALSLAVLLCVAGACEGVDERPASWSYVHGGLLAPSCATAQCHAAGAARAGVDLSTSAAAYAVLTGRVCGAPALPGEPIGNFVRPGHPEASRLLYLLRADRTEVMPPDVPLPDGEIAVIERWILEGATCD